MKRLTRILGSIAVIHGAQIEASGVNESSRETASCRGDDLLTQPGGVDLRHTREIYRVKELKKPEYSAEDWQADGFAFIDQRASDFEALRVNQVRSTWDIPRIHRRDLAVDEFREKYDYTGEAVVIDGIPDMSNWKAAHWSPELLAKDYPYMMVKVGQTEKGENIQLTMADFGRYMQTQTDDSPLYVFDDMVYEDPIGQNVMSEGYAVPDLFPDDLFTLMDDDRERPSYRWLLVGPKRSGSGAHIDPVSTSAWNTLLHGRKLWFVAPPENEEIFSSDDEKGGQACHWFTTALPLLRAKHPDRKHYVFVQQPGETIFVPAGWLHAVLNLDDTVAVTQNFVAPQNFELAYVLTQERLPKFTRRWLKKLVDVREDLAMAALKLNSRGSVMRRAWPTAHDDDDDDDIDIDLEEDDDDYDYEYDLEELGRQEL